MLSNTNSVNLILITAASLQLTGCVEFNPKFEDKGGVKYNSNNPLDTPELINNPQKSGSDVSASLTSFSKQDNLTLKPNPTAKNVLITKDNKGGPLFYNSYDKATGKTIKIQAAIQIPSKFNPNSYNRPIVVLGHDGVDSSNVNPSFDPELKIKNNFAKNSVRLSPMIAMNGSIVIIPSYRGENLSEGIKSVAGGDVMDTIGAIRYVKNLLPNSNQSVVNLVGTARGGLTSLLTAQVYPVNKVVIGYSLIEYDKWLESDPKCSKDPKCFQNKTKDYQLLDSWDKILDDEAIGTAKKALGSDLPKFNRNINTFTRFANPKTSVYIAHGLKDIEVPISNSISLAQTLKKNGKVFVFETYKGHSQNPKEGTHDFFTKLPNYIDSKDSKSLQQFKDRFVAESSSINPPENNK